MCSGVTNPLKPGQVLEYDDYVGMAGLGLCPFTQYIEPTVIEVLEAANGLRDPNDLGCYRVAIGQPISLEKSRGFYGGSIDPEHPFRR